MYYAVLSIAVTMFSFMFLFNQKYEKISGSGFPSSLRFLFYTNLVGTGILLVVNRFQFEFTPFTFLCVLAAGANLVLYNICSIRALGRINLSLFSVFAMLGGMVLPFVAGILFFKEPLTVSKVICFLLISISLVFTVQKGDNKKGYLYYIGVFIFNGLSGVISKFFESSSQPKTSEAGFSILLAAFVSVISGTALLFVRKKNTPFSPKILLYSAGCGALSNIGNYLLLIALRQLPASVQYPFVTGGTMIISTLICFFIGEKPSKKELAAVAISFVGIFVLVWI